MTQNTPYNSKSVEASHGGWIESCCEESQHVQGVVADPLTGLTSVVHAAQKVIRSRLQTSQDFSVSIYLTLFTYRWKSRKSDGSKYYNIVWLLVMSGLIKSRCDLNWSEWRHSARRGCLLLLGVIRWHFVWWRRLKTILYNFISVNNVPFEEI